MSPSGANISTRWSLGILIFEMLCGFTPFWDSGSPMKIYENILKGRVKYPPYIHPDAQDLLSRLITADLTKRLGNLARGSKDIMEHAWFAEVTWERLARKDIDAPYVPPIKSGAGDASLFDKYPEETEPYGQHGKDEYVTSRKFVELLAVLTNLQMGPHVQGVLDNEGSRSGASDKMSPLRFTLHSRQYLLSCGTQTFGYYRFCWTTSEGSAC